MQKQTKILTLPDYPFCQLPEHYFDHALNQQRWSMSPKSELVRQVRYNEHEQTPVEARFGSTGSPQKRTHIIHK